MRTISKSRDHFHGTHKGATVTIDREADGRFYIVVTDHGGSSLYDGWAPENVTTMQDAKKEALRGSMLDRETANG
ncbi:MAG: hypothetical protein ACLGJC_13455 [Alphaproteobacteria bacterium]